MIKDKIKITDDIINFIKEEREKTSLTAVDVSTQISRNKSWLSQLENGRLQNINRIDFINIIKTLINKTDEEAEEYIENFLNSLTDIDLDGKQFSLFGIEDEHVDVDSLKQEFDKTTGNIMLGFDIMFKSILDKEDAIKIAKKISNNMHSSDLGYILSIFSLPWCKLADLEHDNKKQLFRKIYDFIKDNGIDCEDCGLKKKKEENC